MAGDQTHGVFGEAIGKRVGAAADIGLDRMGQAVEPGIGGQPQRHRQRQLVIDDRRERATGEPGDQHLLVGLGVGDHGKPRHLRAGAGGCRDRDDRGTGFGDLGRDLVIAHLPAIGDQHRHTFRRIDRAAAAKGDKAVEPALGEVAGAGFDDGGRRVGDSVGEDLPADAGPVQQVDGPAEMPGIGKKGISDDQRLDEAKPPQYARQLGERSTAHRHHSGRRDHRRHGTSFVA